MNSGKSRITRLLFCASLLLATLSGCATVDQKITMNYSPIDRGFGRHTETVVVSKTESTPFARNNKGEWIIGSINNVHGVQMADLLADRNQGEWITEALLLELKHAGYSATCKNPLPIGTAFGIQLSNINAFMNLNRGLVSTEIKHELKFNVDLFLSGVKIKSFAVASRTSQTVSLKASENESAMIILQTIQDAMQQVMSEVNAQTSKK